MYWLHAGVIAYVHTKLVEELKQHPVNGWSADVADVVMGAVCTKECSAQNGD